MNRRIAVLVSVVVISLAACMGGPDAPRKPDHSAPQANEAEKPTTVAASNAPPPFVFVLPEPEPVFVLKKFVTPLRVTPKLESSGEAIGRNVKVAITSASVEKADGGGKLLLIRFSIHNESDIPVKYEPWHATTVKSRMPTAIDENEASISVRTPPKKEIVVVMPLEIPEGKSINDCIAFNYPLRSQKLDIAIPGYNVSLPLHTFTFKIGRDIFAAVEDEQAKQADEERQLLKFNSEHEAWAKRMEIAEQRAFDAYLADLERKAKSSVAIQNDEAKSNPAVSAASNAPVGMASKGVVHSSGQKTVHVSSYTTKSGTFVPAHSRSSPRGR